MIHDLNDGTQSPPTEEPWEVELKTGLGIAPAPNFDLWQARHADALTSLTTSVPTGKSPAGRRILAGIKWIAAALLITAGIFLIQRDGGLNSNAFAESIPGIDNPQSMTWTTVYYSRSTSADGKRTWMTSERHLHSYRHPGQYRETTLDEAGEPQSVEITDARAGRTLSLNLKDKKAVLKGQVGRPDLRGPFAWVGEALRERMVAKLLRVKSVSMQGKKEIDKAQANVVRAMIDRGDDLGYARHDFFFDDKTKQLVGIWIPNENDFDVENAPDRNQPAEKQFSMNIGLGYRQHEVVLNAKVNAADFSLDPPAGFAFEAQSKPTVTEEEAVTFLGAAAKFNDGLFPDSPYAAFDQKKFNEASMKPLTDQTAAERELIELHDKFLMREIHRSPVLQFVDDQSAPDSFHYVGAGAKLGQADKLICWYAPRGTTRLRGLFGDLTVRDVKQADLPFDPLK